MHTSAHEYLCLAIKMALPVLAVLLGAGMLRSVYRRKCPLGLPGGMSGERESKIREVCARHESILEMHGAYFSAGEKEAEAALSGEALRRKTLWRIVLLKCLLSGKSLPPPSVLMKEGAWKELFPLLGLEHWPSRERVLRLLKKIPAGAGEECKMHGRAEKECICGDRKEGLFYLRKSVLGISAAVLLLPAAPEALARMEISVSKCISEIQRGKKEGEHENAGSCRNGERSGACLYVQRLSQLALRMLKLAFGEAAFNNCRNLGREGIKQPLREKYFLMMQYVERIYEQTGAELESLGRASCWKEKARQAARIGERVENMELFSELVALSVTLRQARVEDSLSFSLFEKALGTFAWRVLQSLIGQGRSASGGRREGRDGQKKSPFFR